MANRFRSGDHIRIFDGQIEVTVIDENQQRFLVECPDGHPGVVIDAVLGGFIYLVRVTIPSNSRVITGTAIFAELVLRPGPPT